MLQWLQLTCRMRLSEIQVVPACVKQTFPLDKWGNSCSVDSTCIRSCAPLLCYQMCVFFVLRMEELDRHFVHDFLLIHVLERIAEYLKCSLLNHQQLGSLQRKLLKSGTCSSPKAAAKALFSFFFCTARWCNWCIHEAAGFDWHYCRVDRFYRLYHLVASSEVFMIPHVLPCFVGMFRKLNQQKHVRLTMKVVKGQWN